jgi:phage head maturation protease
LEHAPDPTLVCLRLEFVRRAFNPRQPRDPGGRWAAAAIGKILDHPELKAMSADDRAVVEHHVNAARTDDHTVAQMHLADARRRATARGAKGLATAITRLHSYHKRAATEPLGIVPLVTQRQFDRKIRAEQARPRPTPRVVRRPGETPPPFQLSGTGAIRSLAHEPIGRPGGPGVWHMKGQQYPAYFQHIRNDLIESGHTVSEAHRLAWGILRNFAAGHDGKGHPVSAETQAKAVEALAQMKRLQAEAKATRSEPMATEHDADGLDQSWDGSHDDLPDLTGLGVPEIAAAAGDTDDGGEVTRARLGTGARFANLKKALAAKGASDPGALAAHIGRKKWGKGRFAALAAKARKPGAAPATASRAGELVRYYPLEECRIMRGSEGESSGRVVEAYAAIWNTPAEIKDHQGHYIEEIDRGAFDQVLEEIRPERNRGFWNVTCLFNHGLTVHGTPAERFSLPAGVTRHVSPEGQGLLTRTEYAATPLGEELLELVNIGALRSQSFTGGIVRSDPQLGPGRRYGRQLGGMLQHVRRLVLGLREYGLTPFAAYSGAEVLGVRMQLPTGYEPWEEDHDPDALAADGGDGDGSSPPAEPVERSTGNRLWRLRTEELLREHGIKLGG